MTRATRAAAHESKAEASGIVQPPSRDATLTKDALTSLQSALASIGGAARAGTEAERLEHLEAATAAIQGACTALNYVEPL